MNPQNRKSAICSIVRRFLFWTTAFFASLAFIELPTFAAETQNQTAAVTVNYIDYENLSKEQQTAITKGTPSEKAQNPTETYWLVYQKKRATAEITAPVISPTKKKPTEGNLASGNREKLLENVSTGANTPREGSTKNYPQTGAQKRSLVLMITGVVLLFTAIGFYARKKQGKLFFLLAVLFTGASLSVPATAADTKLKEPVQKTIAFGEQMVGASEAIDGYDYYGYIYQPTVATPPAKVAAPITINYVDQDGNSLQAPAIVKGAFGEAKTIDIPKIDGYAFKKADNLDENNQILVSEQPQTVTLSYAQQGTIKIYLSDMEEASTGNFSHHVKIKRWVYASDHSKTVPKNITLTNDVGADFEWPASYPFDPNQSPAGDGGFLINFVYDDENGNEAVDQNNQVRAIVQGYVPDTFTKKTQFIQIDYFFEKWIPTP